MVVTIETELGPCRPEMAYGSKKWLLTEFIESIMGVYKEGAFWVIWVRGTKGILWQFGLGCCGIAPPWRSVYWWHWGDSQAGAQVCASLMVWVTRTHCCAQTEVSTPVSGEGTCNVEDAFYDELAIDFTNPNKSNTGLLVQYKQATCHEGG